MLHGSDHGGACVRVGRNCGSLRSGECEEEEEESAGELAKGCNNMAASSWREFFDEGVDNVLPLFGLIGVHVADERKS